MTIKEEKNYLQKGLTIIMSIGLAVSSWFLTQAYDSLKNLDNRIQKIELTQAETSGNRFTISDWTREKAILDAKEIEKERRFSTIESDLRIVKDTVLEIKQELKKSTITKN